MSEIKDEPRPKDLGRIDLLAFVPSVMAALAIGAFEFGFEKQIADSGRGAATSLMMGVVMAGLWLRSSKMAHPSNRAFIIVLAVCTVVLIATIAASSFDADGTIEIAPYVAYGWNLGLGYVLGFSLWIVARWKMSSAQQ